MIGISCTCDIKNVKNISKTPIDLMHFVENVGKILEMTILEMSTYVFATGGISLSAIIAESHIFLHTWTEEEVVTFEFFTCGKVTEKMERSLKNYLIEFWSVEAEDIEIIKQNRVPDRDTTGVVYRIQRKYNMLYERV